MGGLLGFSLINYFRGMIRCNYVTMIGVNESPAAISAKRSLCPNKLVGYLPSKTGCLPIISADKTTSLVSWLKRKGDTGLASVFCFWKHRLISPNLLFVPLPDCWLSPKRKKNSCTPRSLLFLPSLESRRLHGIGLPREGFSAPSHLC